MQYPQPYPENLEAVVFGRDKHSVDVQTAHKMVQDDGYTIVDVRTPIERREGHPPGSKHLMLDAIPRYTNTLEDTKVLAICRTGNRSGSAVRYLRGQGIEAINVKGGMVAWARAGLPIKKGK
jgi:rhodanese-related sulfurtransferase